MALFMATTFYSGNYIRVIGIIDRIHGAGQVIIHKIIKFATAHGKCIYHFTFIDLVCGARLEHLIHTCPQRITQHFHVYLGSLRSDWAIMLPIALGMAPIPNCKQAPLHFFQYQSGYFMSTSVKGYPEVDQWSVITLNNKIDIEMWMDSLVPPDILAPRYLLQQNNTGNVTDGRSHGTDIAG